MNFKFKDLTEHQQKYQYLLKFCKFCKKYKLPKDFYPSSLNNFNPERRMCKTCVLSMNREYEMNKVKKPKGTKGDTKSC